MQGSSHVGSAIKVLRSRVTQVDGVGVDSRAFAWLGLVVDDGSAEQVEMSKNMITVAFMVYSLCSS